jgi:hypothetical protein
MTRLDRPDDAAIEAWLLYLADPVRPRRRQPKRGLAPDDAVALMARAEGHGVLPAVMRNLAGFSADGGFAAGLADGQARLRTLRALSLMLRGASEALIGDLAGLPVRVVKGPVFARTIYPEPGLRTFTDIDLLAAPEVLDELGALLVAHGFQLDGDAEPGVHHEWKWVHRDNPVVMVEVHTDLVKADGLKRRLTLTHADLGEEAETAAGCLMIALIHGAYSHHFSRIQHMIDICQAARAVVTPEDERCFAALVNRIGAHPVAAAGLELAGRAMAEPRCRALTGMFGWRLRAAAAMAGHSFTRRGGLAWWLGGWRRQVLHQLLIYSGHAT